jgi:hypothetical protein
MNNTDIKNTDTKTTNKATTLPELAFMGDILTLSGSFSKVGRADRPLYVWGPSGTAPHLGTKHFCEAIELALSWDAEAGRGPINPESISCQPL